MNAALVERYLSLLKDDAGIAFGVRRCFLISIPTKKICRLIECGTGVCGAVEVAQCVGVVVPVGPSS
jgi:hypothetical protein